MVFLFLFNSLVQLKDVSLFCPEGLSQLVILLLQLLYSGFKLLNLFFISMFCPFRLSLMFLNLLFERSLLAFGFFNR